ncbi:hypothetical protein [Motilimonas sp. KMU-193]|uniref:hypothetical protein n=1 Tax=Motilimonas sp. KMU-193 TaxID=3388668 RepID=UPI00396B0BBF
MQIEPTQNLTSSPAQSPTSMAIKQASVPLVPPQQEYLKLSRQAEQLAEQNQNQTDSVKVSASTGQSQSQGSLTEQQAIALYRKIASLL